MERNVNKLSNWVDGIVFGFGCMIDVMGNHRWLSKRIDWHYRVMRMRQRCVDKYRERANGR